MPDADVEVEGVPVAPLDVRCHDANKDYVVVTWKQPAVEGSSSILGYYIDRWVSLLSYGLHHFATILYEIVKNKNSPLSWGAYDTVYSICSETGLILDVLEIQVNTWFTAFTNLNVSRCEVGTHHWARCNEVPVKYARFPVTGLVEGRSYVFRVRAVNKAGVSHPSRVSEAVVAMDPSDRARLRGETQTHHLLTHFSHVNELTFFFLNLNLFNSFFQTAGPSAPWTGMIKFTEEDPTGTAPFCCLVSENFNFSCLYKKVLKSYWTSISFSFWPNRSNIWTWPSHSAACTSLRFTVQ